MLFIVVYKKSSSMVSSAASAVSAASCGQAPNSVKLRLKMQSISTLESLILFSLCLTSFVQKPEILPMTWKPILGLVWLN